MLREAGGREESMKGKTIMKRRIRKTKKMKEQRKRVRPEEQAHRD